MRRALPQGRTPSGPRTCRGRISTNASDVPTAPATSHPPQVLHCMAFAIGRRGKCGRAMVGGCPSARHFVSEGGQETRRGGRDGKSLSPWFVVLSSRRVGRVFETHHEPLETPWWVSKTRPTLHKTPASPPSAGRLAAGQLVGQLVGVVDL